MAKLKERKTVVASVVAKSVNLKETFLFYGFAKFRHRLRTFCVISKYKASGASSREHTKRNPIFGLRI